MFELGGRHPGSTFVRPLSSGAAISIITQDREPLMRVVRLDNALQDVGKPVGLGQFNSKRSYLLPDRSIVIFGGTFHRGDTAAVGRLRKNSSSLDLTALEPFSQSPWIIDAVPTNEPDEFAAIRITGYRAVLTWISLEK
jgi:hypothetical protein